MKVLLDSRTSEAYCRGGLLRRWTIKPFSSDKSISTVGFVNVTFHPYFSLDNIIMQHFHRAVSKYDLGELRKHAGFYF